MSSVARGCAPRTAATARAVSTPDDIAVGQCSTKTRIAARIVDHDFERRARSDRRSRRRRYPPDWRATTRPAAFRRVASWFRQSIARARRRGRAARRPRALPSPPPFETIASRRPEGGRARASVSTASNSSSSAATRSMPARRNAAAYSASAPARRPVCDATARALSAWRPPLTDDHRLRSRGRARGRHEFARMRDRLDVQQNRARVRSHSRGSRACRRSRRPPCRRAKPGAKNRCRARTPSPARTSQSRRIARRMRDCRAAA